MNESEHFQRSENHIICCLGLPLFSIYIGFYADAGDGISRRSIWYPNLITQRQESRKTLGDSQYS